MLARPSDLDSLIPREWLTAAADSVEQVLKSLVAALRDGSPIQLVSCDQKSAGVAEPIGIAIALNDDSATHTIVRVDQRVDHGFAQRDVDRVVVVAIASLRSRRQFQISDEPWPATLIELKEVGFPRSVRKEAVCPTVSQGRTCSKVAKVYKKAWHSILAYDGLMLPKH